MKRLRVILFVLFLVSSSQAQQRWTKTYGGTSQDVGYSVQQTLDGGYIIAGYTNSFGIHGDVYLIKTNASGDTIWTKTYGGTYPDVGNSVQQTSDGGFIIAGLTDSFGGSDVYLIKTDALGDTLWTRTYGGTGIDWDRSVQQTTDGGYIIAGYTDSFGAGSDDVYLIKTDANGNVGVENNSSSRLSPYASRLTVSPNPFTSFATIPGHSSDRFTLYDVSGRKVGVYKGDRVGEGLAAGVYFLRSSDNKDKPLRIVKVR